MYSTVLVFGILAAIYCTVSTRRYRATSTIQVQKESSSGLGLDSLMSSGEDASDALEADIVIQTQANILQSDTLALRTIENLHMEQTDDFRSHWSPIGWFFGLISPEGATDTPGVRLEDAPMRRRNALGIFAKNLKVKPVAGTRLIEIDYLSSNPKLAALVVNDLTQGLTDYTFQTRYNATNQASNWLAAQLTELRKQSEDLQAKVVDMERQSGVYNLGTTDAQGRDQAYSGVLDQLQQTTTALSMAEQNRILKEAVAQAAQSGDAEMLSGLSGNTMAGNTSMSNSMELIQSLRQQEASQQASLQEISAKYGPSYPKLAELRASIAGLEHSIQEEVARIKERAKSDYAIALRDENETRTKYLQAKQQADKLNDKTIQYSILRQDAQQSRDLYEDLLKRLKEAGVLEGLKSSNITVVDPARVPAEPVKPNVPAIMLAALCGGGLLGCLGGLLVDTLDRNISSINEVEELTGQPLLGATPLFGADVRQPSHSDHAGLTVLDDPHSTFAEALRAIRTSILLTGGSGSRVILVTSSIPGEGKSTICANLAAVFAQSNRKVLLVDLDMRRGSLRRLVGQPVGTGLSELLAEQQEEVPIVSIKVLPNLHFLQSGRTSPNPSELLDSQIKNWISAWREQYDFILLDAPPMLPVADAQIVHPLADITVLMARTNFTERAQLQRSFRLLTSSSKHFVGVIVNGLRPHDENYYGYYGYKNYADHYGEDENENS